MRKLCAPILMGRAREGDTGEYGWFWIGKLHKHAIDAVVGGCVVYLHGQMNADRYMYIYIVIINYIASPIKIPCCVVPKG